MMYCASIPLIHQSSQKPRGKESATMYLTPSRLLLAALALLLASCEAAKVTNPNKVPKEAVLLSQVDSLTVRAGKQTKGRRSSPVPQLQCVGPAEVCKLYSVDVMRCKNEGGDYDAENIQWSCTASLPEEFKLGSTDVGCEGYASRDDPFVLKGSCGVEYRLLLTDKGEEKYGSQSRPWEGGDFYSGPANIGSKVAKALFLLVFMAVAAFIIGSFLYACLTAAPRPEGRRPPQTWGGFGGGGNDNDDPPPPYDYPRHQTTPKKPAPRASTYTKPSSSRTQQRQQGQQQGWRPGFWSGTAAGAAAGYFAGSRGNNNTAPETTQQQRPAGGGLFGNLGGGTRTAQPSAPSRPSPPSPPSYSSGRHESTGFGSTSRR